MAKLFANLDRLKNQPTPIIMSNEKPIDYAQQAVNLETNKATTISLANRLTQPDLKTTKHLAQFYLSDTYTGFLKIKNFGVQEFTSNIVVKEPKEVFQGSIKLDKYNYNPIQGGTNPTTVIGTNIILNHQGVITTNNISTSVTSVTTPVSVVNQGSIVLQNILTTPNQGSINIAQPNPIINQGVGENLTLPREDVRELQGILVRLDGRNTSGVEKTNIVVKTPSAVNANVINPNVKIVAPTSTIEPQVPNTVKIESPEQRAAINSLNLTNKKAAAAPLLSVAVYQSVSLTLHNKNTAPLLQGSNLIDTLTKKYYQSHDQFDPTQSPVNKFAAGDINKLELINVLGAESITADQQTTLANAIKLGYPTKNYPKRSNQPNDDTSWKVTIYKGDQFESFNLDNELGSILKNADALSQSNVNEAKIVITRLGTNDTVTFTAFLTSLSDTTTPSYTDYSYVGKQDIFKAYKGTTRAISLGFKAVALGFLTQPSTANMSESRLEVKELAQKVNKLINIAGIGRVGAQKYTEGPVLKLKIVGLYNNVIVVANSVKVDIPVEDATWDDGVTVKGEGPMGHKESKLLPNYYNISMDFAVLSTNEDNGTLFDINKNYIGY